MNKRNIPLSVPNLKGNELAYVTKAIETEWVSTGGPYVNDFENKISEYVHSAGAVACQNGTSGLHTGLLLCGVSSGDEVIVPALTFIAAVNPVKYIGAEPVFMDCDDSLCMDPEKLDEFCSNECTQINGVLTNKKTNRQIKAVVVVHVFGNMADMEKIMTVAGKYGLRVVEDATEALGTYYKDGIYTGKFAGTIGTVGVYSFNGNKIITTGGGGMIVSNDISLLKKAKRLTTQAKTDEANFIHDDVGYNYRMTNLQAALGLAQLEQLEHFIEIKKSNYEIYRSAFCESKDYKILGFRSDIRSNHWFYSLYCCDSKKRSRDNIINYLRDNHIQTRPIWGLINEQLPYVNSQSYKIDKAKMYWMHIVNVPCSTNLTEDDAYTVINMIKEV
ncbi:MAG TPA: LegC family aminotransferase [Bacillota bacterium]|nr:LegC family aminotransferase [Bacillota bacterium]